MVLTDYIYFVERHLLHEPLTNQVADFEGDLIATTLVRTRLDALHFLRLVRRYFDGTLFLSL